MRAHGIKGELACEVVTDYPQRFRRTKRVFLQPSTRPRPPAPTPVAGAPPGTGAGSPGGEKPASAEAPSNESPVPREHVVERARVVPYTRGAQVVLRLEGIADREAAEALRGWLVQVPEDEAWKLPKGQYYWHQIIGLVVVTRDGRRLGTVADILETGANDVYVVRREGTDLLLPAIKDVVKEISPERGEMLVELLPGME
ncbi:MAG: ribosome maturation factor RimM [Chloroflexota bacterium]|nr:ribosome maturation factor RimM [Chloroflexota bacterium]